MQAIDLGGVERRRRLVKKNENARILQQGARDFDQLAIRQRQAMQRSTERDICAKLCKDLAGPTSKRPDGISSHARRVPAKGFPRH